MDIVRHIIHIQISLHSISSHFYWFRRREKTRENTSSDLCIKYWFIDFPGWLQKFTSKLTDWQRREQLAVNRTLGKKVELSRHRWPLSHFNHPPTTLSFRPHHENPKLKSDLQISFSFKLLQVFLIVHREWWRAPSTRKARSEKRVKEIMKSTDGTQRRREEKKCTARWWWREVTRPKYISRVYSFHSAHE